MELSFFAPSGSYTYHNFVVYNLSKEIIDFVKQQDCYVLAEF